MSIIQNNLLKLRQILKLQHQQLNMQHHQAMSQLKPIQLQIMFNQFKHLTFKAHHHMSLQEKQSHIQLDQFKLLITFLQDQEQDTAEVKMLFIQPQIKM